MHAQGQQQVRDDQVDHDKRDIDQKTDLEPCLQLRKDKGRDQQYQVIAADLSGHVCGPQTYGAFLQMGQHIRVGVAQHKALQWLYCLQPAALQGLHAAHVQRRLLEDLRGVIAHRRHDKQRRCQGNTVEGHARRHLLHADGVAGDHQHDADFQERGTHHHQHGQQ